MPHEVVKRVGQRAYRYRVESYRDPETKKVRSRWTYLGRDETAGASAAAAGPVVSRRSPERTRERLLDAFERLVERLPYAEVTAGAVADDAGFAHGTFYRHFSDKRAVLIGALARVREEFERATPTFDPPYGSLQEERERVRAWVSTVLRKPATHRGVLRSWYDAMRIDDELRAVRETRRRARVDALAAYLEKLSEAGTIEAPAVAALATALVAMVDAVFRIEVVERDAPDELLVTGAIELFVRSIFPATRDVSRPELTSRSYP